MPIATQCLAPDCTTMTIGPFCIEHEPVTVPRAFTRGRPAATAPPAAETAVTVTEADAVSRPLVAA